ncbi:hypothetical protein BKI49_13625 [Streptomyces sp. Tue6028]|uniref:hypothetical protein n=1 Tax=Streptomyces sp. Tue6028 TaxID=2036037 RepID=UPI000BC6AB99|nr:hypothetical protein [Streptomyces sp. Tue6028]PBC63432.1 hypothetical protein BKI49_13625 [Streptomyces sp. Tue6028]
MRSKRITLCAGAAVVAAFAPTAWLAPLAFAADPGTGVLLTPAAPAPGTDVRLRATGCSGRTGTATSSAFVSDARLTAVGGGVLTGDTRVTSGLAPGTYAVEVDCDGRGGKVRGVAQIVPRSSATQGAVPDLLPNDIVQHLLPQDIGPTIRVPQGIVPTGIVPTGIIPTALVPQDRPDAAEPGRDSASDQDSATDHGSDFASAPAEIPASPVAPVHAGGGGTVLLATPDARAAGPGTRQAVIGLVLAGVAAVAVAILPRVRGSARTVTRRGDDRD